MGRMVCGSEQKCRPVDRAIYGGDLLRVCGCSPGYLVSGLGRRSVKRGGESTHTLATIVVEEDRISRCVRVAC
jgi:hypothetical protein